MVPRLRVCIPLFLALLLAVPPGRTIHAAGAMMQVEPFFNGHFKYGEWLPLHISLSNDGPPRQIQVRADTTTAGAQTIFVASAELATGARKRLTLYVLPPSFARALRIRLMDGENELESQTVDVTVERNVVYLVGVVAVRTQAFSVLNNVALSPSASGQFLKGPSQYTRSVKMIPIPLADIPDRPEGLRALDALVFTGVDTSELSPAQKSTLATWVDQGGRLILGGGAAAGRTLAGIPEELVKEYRAVGDAQDIASLTELAKFADEEIRVPGPFPVTWAPAGPHVVIEQEGNGLVVEKQMGQGYVTYVALDLAASPFDAWAGAADFWIKLLTPGSAYPQGMPPDVSPRTQRANGMWYALQNLPALELPSLAWLGSLLGLYLLLVGPVNYLVLRRLHKLAWGWLTIPGLTLLFSVGAFGCAYYLRGGDVIINKISVLTFGPGEPTPVQTYVGIFSPERSTYSLAFKGLTLVAPMAMDVNPFGGGGMTSSAVTQIVEGEPTEVRGIQVNQFAMQGFTAESPVPEGWGVESDLTVEGDQLRGTLVNRTSQAMVDPVIVFGNHLSRLDTLLPAERRSLDQKLVQGSGEQFPYSLTNWMAPSGPTGPSREAQVRQQLLSSYFQNPGAAAQPPSRPTLVAWMRASPLDVQITGTRWTTQQMSLVVATLNMHYAPGHIHLAPRDLIAQLAESQGNVGVCGPYNQVILNSGSMVLAFSLPEELASLRITRLGLSIQGDDAPTVEVANREGEWIKLSSPHAGWNELSEPARFVSDDGSVRVRLSVSGNASPRTCAQYDLDVEGDLEK